MDEAVKAAWVQALRSGEYTQTIGRLERTAQVPPVSVGHCCLGVLCDVLIKQPALAPGLDLQRSPDSHVGGFTLFVARGTASYNFLPTSVGRAIGLDDDFQCELSSRNDGSFLNGHAVPKHSFAEIADIIEARA